MEVKEQVQFQETNKYIALSSSTISFGMELYWINQLKKKNLVSDEEYDTIKSDIYKKYKKVGN